MRGTVQLAEGHTVWLKYYQSPGEGILRDDYWPGFGFPTGDREAITAQEQTAENWAAQWSGVLAGQLVDGGGSGHLQLAHHRGHVRTGHFVERAHPEPR